MKKMLLLAVISSYSSAMEIEQPEKETWKQWWKRQKAKEWSGIRDDIMDHVRRNKGKYTAGALMSYLAYTYGPGIKKTLVEKGYTVERLKTLLSGKKGKVVASSVTSDYSFAPRWEYAPEESVNSNIVYGEVDADLMFPDEEQAYLQNMRKESLMNELNEKQTRIMKKYMDYNYKDKFVTQERENPYKPIRNKETGEVTYPVDQGFDSSITIGGAPWGNDEIMVRTQVNGRPYQKAVNISYNMGLAKNRLQYLKSRGLQNDQVFHNTEKVITASKDAGKELLGPSSIEWEEIDQYNPEK